MGQNFQNAKVYKITNDYNNDIYVGSTCNTLIKRFSYHKNDCKKERVQNMPLYALMKQIGFQRFRIQLIENVECEDKYMLRQREGHWIRAIGTLNMKIEGRTEKEWRKDNVEKLKMYDAKRDQSEQRKEYKKTYREDNQEYFKLKNKEWCQNNKEARSQYSHEKRNNIENIKELDKANNAKRKEYFKQRYIKQKEEKQKLIDSKQNIEISS
jgi:hypothetical protein